MQNKSKTGVLQTFLAADTELMATAAGKVGFYTVDIALPETVSQEELLPKAPVWFLY